MMYGYPVYLHYYTQITILQSYLGYSTAHKRLAER